ncbi:MAG: protein-glutamate methylesterase/protein-glutamine glutaminase [Mangrovicoccus sp.]
MRLDSPIKVLIVDDSPTVRQVIAQVLDTQPDIIVMAEAAHPYEAREIIKKTAPDVIILDVEMPMMNGIDFLRRIMERRPTPVIMFSSLTQKGSEDAIEALALGAIDCIGKTANFTTDGTLDLLPKMIRAATKASLIPHRSPRSEDKSSQFEWDGKYILIGSSTGGVDALETVLEGFPKNCPPTMIVQHMPRAFVESFAARLNSRTHPLVKVAENGDLLAQGCVYVAPGEDTHLEVEPGKVPKCKLIEGNKVSGHRPSVDVLFNSAVPIAKKTVAIILTGMGSDGAKGMKKLRENGARTLAQDQQTCVVYGMPRVAFECGGAERAMPLEKISHHALDLCTKLGSPRNIRKVNV